MLSLAYEGGSYSERFVFHGSCSGVSYFYNTRKQTLLLSRIIGPSSLEDLGMMIKYPQSTMTNAKRQKRYDVPSNGNLWSCPSFFHPSERCFFVSDVLKGTL